MHAHERFCISPPSKCGRCGGIRSRALGLNNVRVELAAGAMRERPAVPIENWPDGNPNLKAVKVHSSFIAKLCCLVLMNSCSGQIIMYLAPKTRLQRAEDIKTGPAHVQFAAHAQALHAKYATFLFSHS